MKAVIMAGGKGTRLYNLTQDQIPKPMVYVNGKPILRWQIENLKENGINDIIIVIGHLGEQIQEYFDDGARFGVSITYIKEKTPLGTGGAIYMLKDILYEDFLLVYGDLIFNIDISRMYQYHKEHQAYATLFVHPNSHPFDSDLMVTDKDNRILNIDSKHNTRNYWYHNCTNAGVYMLSPIICSDVMPNHPTSLDELLWYQIQEGRKIYAYYSSEYVHDVGTLIRLTTTERDLYWDIPQKRNLKNKQKAIFLDRDGVINKEVGLLYDEDQFELLPTASKALRNINHSSYLAIVVTNQSVIARGLCTEEELENIHKKMETLLGDEGAYVDKIYYCPHHPDGGYPEEVPSYKIKCDCRKPNIGMILKAAEDFNIDLSSSWIIGDRNTDIQTGINAGLRTILVGDRESNIIPDYAVENVYKAVQIILGEQP